MVPLPGHTRGHCGVAVRMSEGWLFHCGDAHLHHSEVAAVGGAAPAGLRFFEALMSVDNAARLANQARDCAISRGSPRAKSGWSARTIPPSSRR